MSNQDQGQSSTIRMLWQVVAFTLALGVLVLAAWLIWLFIDRLLSSPPEITTAIIGAAVTVLVAVWSVVVGKMLQSRRENEIEHRARKLPFYEEFVSWVFKLADVADQESHEKDLEEFLKKFSQKIILWASPEVVRAYGEFRYCGNEAADDKAVTPKRVACAERLLLAIRQDLGHRNKGLRQFDVLRVFVNDLDTALLSDESDKVAM